MDGRPGKERNWHSKKRSSATIYDIAKQTGVSKSTVSRVVNGDENVHPDTRALVTKAIKALRFSPNSAARSLSNGTEARIGLVYANPSVSYFTELLMGALESSSRNGAHLMVDRCEGRTLEGAYEVIRSLVKAGLSGIVLATPLNEQHKLIKELADQGIAVVLIATGRFRSDINCVDIDNYKAAYEMTKYLIGLGHKKIGFVKGHPNITSSKLRYKGVMAALRDAGSKVAKPVVVQGYNNYRSGLDAAEQILSNKPDVTAIFANNDDMASAVMSLAHRKGMDVPQDLSVVGFDDTIAGMVWPELTTIRQHIATIASTAVDMLMQDIRSSQSGIKPTPRNRLIDYTLVVRESAAAPR